MRYWIGVAVLLVFALVILALSRRPKVEDFVFDSRKVILTAIKFDGQGVQATLKDRSALEYLASRPKLKTLSKSEGGERTLTFSAICFDKWGSIGRLDIGIGKDKKVWDLTYVESWFGLESRRYLIIDSNRPTKLDDLMTFLLDERNRGASWRE
jgi:hypothetical protein